MLRSAFLQGPLFTLGRNIVARGAEMRDLLGGLLSLWCSFMCGISLSSVRCAEVISELPHPRGGGRLGRGETDRLLENREIRQ